MPLPIAAIGLGAQIGQGVFNAVSQGVQNKKNREFQERMMNTQRKWALSDQQALNEYNSPQSQMQRYKAAGLNPHLIYGQTNEGATVRPTESANYQGNAPQLDVNPSGAVGMYNQTRIADIQTDNLLKQGQVLDEERINKKADTTVKLAQAQSLGVNTERAQFDLGIESELRPTQLAFRQGMLKKQTAETFKTEADTVFTLDKNEREKVIQAKTLPQMAATLAETLARKSNINASTSEIHERIRLLKLDQKLKADEVELRKNGLTPNSPVYLKVAQKYAEEILGTDTNPTPLKKWWDTKFKFNQKHYGGKPPVRFKY